MPNERCRFKHVDGIGKTTTYEGEIVERVSEHVVRVKPDAFGFTLLVPVADIEARDDERTTQP